MRERRGWVAASVLLLLGAVTGAGAVREHWLSCRGSMLNGSVLRGFTYGRDFSGACLQAMDDGFSLAWPDGEDPWRAETVLGVACALLLALAWTVVVLTSGWSRTTRLLASSPALMTTAAGLITASGARGDVLDPVFIVLLVLINVSALVAYVVIDIREAPDDLTLWKVALALLASTAAGYFPMMADYAFMTMLSDANWDTPPGAGYPTVVTVALLTVALLVLTLRTDPRRSVSGEELVESHA